MGSYVDQRKIGRSGVFGTERKNPRQEGEIPNGPNVLGYPGAGLPRDSFILGPPCHPPQVFMAAFLRFPTGNVTP